MKILWAPWRYTYIMQNVANLDKKECVFCKNPAEHRDKKNLILHRGENTYIMLNLYPYNNGHMMVIPYRHVPDLTDLNENELLELMKGVNLTVKTLRSGLKAQGVNIGINLGKVAGAGIEEHLHVHIVPRWNGDTNFMPVTGKIKVVSQSLSECWDILHAEFNKLNSPK